ncbi:hypothetical protein [Micromonospora aurantiaca (nom. illeg.)]
MGDFDDLNTTKLIGPYPDIRTRDADLTRLARLPHGAPEYHGGCEFLPSIMGAAAGDQFAEVVAPQQVAQATTVKSFFAAYGGWSENVEDGEDMANGEDEVHPDQASLF